MGLLTRLFGKSREERVQDVLENISDWAEEHGCELLSQEDTADFLDWLIDPSISQKEKVKRFLEEE